ncbi:MAG: hydantoinase/oxoprolinase N-terminal domain-containing protein [Pseudomonadales bacterium]
MFNIGIDTGGTYTDAVIVDTEKQCLLASAKSVTTTGDLGIGVISSLAKVLDEAVGQVSSADISLVSLSTTLATNALVEGKGSAIGVVLIGFDNDMVARTKIAEAIPTAHVLRVDGGHLYDGNQAGPLDEASLREQLEHHSTLVDAYAVASMYSVRNGAHERRAQEVILEVTGLPVTASCDLSESLNGPRRALTAAFNARIIALIVGLIKSVEQAMFNKGISAPLMIVKGDGSIASADAIAAAPIETILSGPAASVIGANFISGLKDFVVSDIGGTTTDVAVVKNGWPTLNEDGATIGEHQTMVRAIDMQTIGLGGDSAIEIDYKEDVILKPNRVVPASLIGSRWPSVKIALERSMRAGMGLGMATMFLFRPEGFDRDATPRDLSEADLAFLAEIGEEPIAWSDIVDSVSDRHRVKRLVNRGILMLAGFTPSDAAHVLGYQDQWSKEIAEIVCLMIGRSHGKISFDESKKQAETTVFAQEVFDATVSKSAHVIIETLSGRKFASDDPFVSCIAEGRSQLADLGVSLIPGIPLVAVGGPAPVFYPEVGRRLGVETLIPKGSEVANAIGAATSLIRINAQVSITALEKGGYNVRGATALTEVEGPSEALALAHAMAEEDARLKATANGGEAYDMTVDEERIDIPDMEGDTGLISATVTARCLGKPQ